MTSATMERPVESGAGSTDAEQKEKRYLILGCGPAGMIAAETLHKNGVDPDNIEIVAEQKKPSPITGAQFLHRPIVGDLVKPDGVISVAKIGYKDVYSQKVYGKAFHETSFDKIESQIEAWSLIKEYEILWERYADQIVAMLITPDIMRAFLSSEEYAAVISTIPPVAYCVNPDHTFPYAPIVLGEPTYPPPADNFILYSGRPQDRWYRTSMIFGEEGIEFGLDGDAANEEELLGSDLAELVWDQADLKSGKKPLGTTCDCGFHHPCTKLIRVGRFGKWDRRFLLHQVPAQVSEVL